MQLKSDRAQTVNLPKGRQPHAPPALFNLTSNWYLLKMLTLSDLSAQHIGSVLGRTWFVVKPLVLIGVYTVVFSSAVKAMGGTNNQPINYGLFIFAGMLPWLGVQESVQRGATIVVDLAQLVRHHPLPLGLLPLHVVLSVTLSQVIGIIVFLAIKLLLTGEITLFAPLVLVIIPIQIVFCFSLVFIVTLMNVFIRDISHLTITGLVVWFFASPIVFPIDHFSGTLKSLMWLNPMTGLTEIYRDLLLLGQFPSTAAAGSLVAFSLLLFLAGWGLYHRTHHAIVDWI